MICTRNHQSGTAAKAFVFKHGKSSSPQSVSEWQMTGTAQRAESLISTELEAAGLQLSGDQLIDANRLGVHKDLQKVIPDILFRRFKEDMTKTRIPEAIKQEHREGSLHRYDIPKGIFGSLRHFLKRKTLSDVEMRFEDNFGTSGDLDSAFTVAGHRVLSRLIPGAQQAVETYLSANGIGLPPLPSRTPEGLPANDPVYVRRAAQLGKASPALLMKMCRELTFGDNSVFTLPPDDPLLPQRKKSPAQPIEWLISAKRSLARQRYNQFSTTTTDPQRLASFLHGLETSHTDIHQLITKDILSGGEFYSLEGNKPASDLLLYIEQRMTDPGALLKSLENISAKMPGEKKEKLAPFELLQRLLEDEAEKRGIHDPEMRRTDAIAASAMWSGLTGNLELNRAANNKHAEWLAMGRATRAKSWLKKKLGFASKNKAEDIIDHLAGFDREFAMFKGIQKGMTFEDFTVLAQKNSISDDKLYEFECKLVKVLKDFSGIHNRGIVELFEGGYDIEHLCELIEVVRAARWSRGLAAEAGKSPGNKAEFLVQKLREAHKKRDDDQKAIQAKVGAEFIDYFDKAALKQKFSGLLKEKMMKKKELKMTDSEFLSGLDHDGLSSAYNLLGSDIRKELAGEESATKAQLKAAKKAKSKAEKASRPKSRIVPAIYGKTIKPIYEKALKPVAKKLKGATVATAKVVFFPAILVVAVAGGTWTWIKEPWNKSSVVGGIWRWIKKPWSDSGHGHGGHEAHKEKHEEKQAKKKDAAKNHNDADRHGDGKDDGNADTGAAAPKH